MNPTLTPAYGRDYASKKAVLEDFESGKDFILNIYCDKTIANKQDLISKGVKAVNIRYKKLTMIAVVKLV